MPRTPQQIQAQNHEHFRKASEEGHRQLPRIKVDGRGNREVKMKYDGYMMIQRRKDNQVKSEQYLESVCLKDMMGGKNAQLNTEVIEKFTRLHRIDPYASTLHTGPGVKIPAIHEIESLSLNRNRK